MPMPPYKNPAGLVQLATTLNALAEELREEGWRVTFGTTDDFTRVNVIASLSHSCDPPKKRLIE
jgi:hypothetical protein